MKTTNEARMKTVPMRVVTKELAFYNVVAVLWLGEAISNRFKLVGEGNLSTIRNMARNHNIQML